MRATLRLVVFGVFAAWVSSAQLAQAQATETGQGQCWPAGKVCWDDGGDASCRLNCCSKQYHQDPTTKKDVCDPVKACWNEGTKCWDDLGANSCKLNCCSQQWRHDSTKGYDVCTAPPGLKPAVVGFGGAVDDQMRQTLTIGQAACWSAGTKCWNNRGTDSCVDNCCSKAYYYDNAKASDVCAPIPTDKKCYAQYTPCWDSLPTPKGKYYVEVSTGQQVFFPSCFQCCARISRNGSTRWPAWTEYYIGDGTHDATAVRTHWSDALVAGLQGMNPIQDIIDTALKPTNPSRTARGGRPKQQEVQTALQQGMANYDAQKSQQAVQKAAIGAGVRAISRAGGPIGPVFDFLFGFFSKMVEPQWDLCD